MCLPMAKKITTQQINSAEDLITSRERTRAGFISMALEKNYLAIPYIDEAKTLKSLASKVKKPTDLLKIQDLHIGLLTASGLSEKSLKFLTNEDKTIAIKGLIEEFLEPAGDNFIDELVYRYLLIKGDALGGKARNLAGTLGERKFLRSILSIFNISGIEYQWQEANTNNWLQKPDDDTGIENRIKGLAWTKGNKSRLLVMNLSVPIVNKNIDLIILNGKVRDIKKGELSIINQPDKFMALGELKGGIDPAGADEHWKTAKSALIRIRDGFGSIKSKPKTFFIGAAIEKSMANEIYRDLKIKILSNAANLTNDEQLTAICDWIINL